MCYTPRHEPRGHKRESRTSFSRLGPQAAGLVPAPDRRGDGGQRRGRQSVDAARPSRGTGGAAVRAPSGSASAAHRGTGGPAARLPAARRRSLWVPRPGMDLRTTRGGHSPGVWRLFPSRSCQPHPATETVEPANAAAPCPPTRRSGDWPGARPPLAGHHKGAPAQGQPSLGVDESGG